MEDLRLLEGLDARLGTCLCYRSFQCMLAG